MYRNANNYRPRKKRRRQSRPSLWQMLLTTALMLLLWVLFTRLLDSLPEPAAPDVEGTGVSLGDIDMAAFRKEEPWIDIRALRDLRGAGRAGPLRRGLRQHLPGVDAGG